MNETCARQSGYRVLGVRLIPEFARDLLQAPRPPGLVEEEADHGVVDLILREPRAAPLVWNTLLLHGKAFLSVPGPGQLALRRGRYGRGLYTVDDKASARQTGGMQPRSPAHAAFGHAIRELREANGASQEAFALRCGIDRSHYGGIERGERNPSLSHIFKVADALGVRPSEIHARAERLLGGRR
jgi:DNA-binding XRE family transcriptional regulator